MSIYLSFNIDIEYASLYDAEALGIGSISDALLLSTKDFKYVLKYINKEPIYVLSSGFGWDHNHYKSKFRYFYNMILKRQFIPVGLRGKLTENICTKVFNIDTLNTVLGDLGLLSSYLIPDNNVEKLYDIGICPHYADKNHPILNKIISECPNSIMIDTMQDPIDFLNKLKLCKAVISTGLHPLIAADSMGIPNMWVRVSEKTTTMFKFQDYYSDFDIERQPFILNEDSKINLDFIIQNYNINSEIVKNVKNKLYQTYDEFFKLYSKTFSSNL